MQIMIAILSFAVVGIFLIRSLFHLKRKPDHRRDFEMGTFLNQETLSAHGRELARDMQVSQMRHGRYRPDFDREALIEAVSVLKTRETDLGAGEWLVDNFYLLSNELTRLSACRLNDLPIILRGRGSGKCRVQYLAEELCAHSDCHIDRERMELFLNAFGEKTPLLMREIGAFEPFLHISLIQAICKLSRRLTYILKTEKEAYTFGERFLLMPEEKLLRHSGKADSPIFMERLIKKLLESNSDQAEKAHSVVAVYLEGEGKDIHQLVRQAQSEYSTVNQRVANCIKSLQMLSQLRFDRVYEQVCAVHGILRSQEVYSGMEKSSQRYYRQQVEKLARQYGVSEVRLARGAVELANASGRELGYYLLSDGQRELRSALGVKGRFLSRNTLIKRRFRVYSGAILGISLLAAGGLSYAQYLSSHLLWQGVVSFILNLIVIWGVVTAVVDRCVIACTKPVLLPKLDFKAGVPREHSAVVALPTLLTGVHAVAEAAEKLERHYLSNQSEHLYFVLLGDFKESDREEVPEDEQILREGINAVNRLNRKYGKEIFYYLQRRRVWSAGQGKYMAYERKRGALVQLAQLMRGEGEEHFFSLGDVSPLREGRYIVTLDADTVPGIDQIKRLVGTMAHPLNQPVMKRGRVVSGYGVIEPGVDVSVTSLKTDFAFLYAAGKGLEPYTFAVSDVYQDLFDAGSFVGKGIISVEALLTCADPLIAPDRVLSHDLLEGSLIRGALCTDIRMTDGFPPHAGAYFSRLHRWVRGDWQLLPWLGSTVRDRQGKRVKNPLSTLAKWKIVDNLRRSLNAPGIFFMLVLSLTVFRGNIWTYLLVAGVSVFLPLFFEAYHSLKQLIGEKNIYAPDVVKELKTVFLRLTFSFTFLAYETFTMADAIVKTLWRLIRKRNLLCWVTAADAERQFKPTLYGYIRKMWVPLMAAVAFFLISLAVNGAWRVAFLLALAWSGAPLLAYGSGLLNERRQVKFRPDQRHGMLQLARLTWDFYDVFTTRQTNFLPPDNVQEEPYLGIAPRTSPTNIGMYLLGSVAARDMGFISGEELLCRLEDSIRTVESLPKWNGHLLNWYNIETLEPLRPRYVSVVDSGNLLGYLMTAHEAVKELSAYPLVDRARIEGLITSLELALKEQEENGLSATSVKGLMADLTKCENVKDYYARLLACERVFKQAKGGIAKRINQEIKISIKQINTLMPYLAVLEEMPDISYYPEAQQMTQDLCACLEQVNSVSQGEKATAEALRRVEELTEKGKNNWCQTPFGKWLALLEHALREAAVEIRKRLRRQERLGLQLKALIEMMDFRPLYDERADLFYIGYHLDEGQMSESHYDLFASEVRQAAYIAVSQGDVPVATWFRMNRPMSQSGEIRMLMSWTGTMFEYLMPRIIMRTYAHTLLDEAEQAAVAMQRRYGQKRRVPFGVSESGFYAFDAGGAYQYQAFGIPGMGMKAGLGEDTVVAPYASALALPVVGQEAYKNILSLIKLDALGRYGLYEAVDFTRDRVGKERFKLVKSYMAHHQGMILASLDNAVNGEILVNRFHSIPRIQAAEQLLQERIPQHVSIEEARPEAERVPDQGEQAVRVIREPDSTETQILSNGTYLTVIDASGSGYSQYRGRMLNRWTEDSVINDRGLFLYIKNVTNGDVWSATQQPFHAKNPSCKAVFTESEAAFSRRDGQVQTKLRICVSGEENAEIRELTLHNHGEQETVLEVTSYMELALNGQRDDASHRAYSNLFVHTAFDEKRQVLIARRKCASGKGPVAVHFIAQEGRVEYETNRARFLGRGNEVDNPASVNENAPLSNTVGAVVEPCFALRRRVHIPSQAEVKLTFVLAAAEEMETAMETVQSLRETGGIKRSFAMAEVSGKLMLKHFHIRPRQAILYQRLAERLIRRRFVGTGGSKSGLWPLGISGDLPVALVMACGAESAFGIRELTSGYRYLQMKGFHFDCVFAVDEEEGYFQPIREQLHHIARTSGHGQGRIHVFNLRGCDKKALDNLKQVACVILDAARPLQGQLEQKGMKTGDLLPIRAQTYPSSEIPLTERVEGDNGYGMFADDGREYLIRHREGRTPLPWSNVLANPHFGSVVTESGGGFTWAENSRQNKLTLWSNDPVTDRPSEVVYLRDEETGEYWTVTPSPIRVKGDYLTRHGRGYTAFEFNGYALAQTLTEFVPQNKRCKYYWLKIKNTAHTPRVLSATFFADVLCHSDRTSSVGNLRTVAEEGKLFMENVDGECIGLTWIAVTGGADSLTDDRRAFIGQNHQLSAPMGMRVKTLPGLCGQGEKSAVLRKEVTLPPEGEAELVFALGYADSLTQAKEDSRLDSEQVAKLYRETVGYWDHLPGRISIKTHQRSLDLLMNNWIPYQIFASRIYARAGYYQAGGAYGFRDQLQDMLGAIYFDPQLVRRTILAFAAHQFESGDVQHWWHPPCRGVRTRITDDKLFLPYVVSEYIRHTEDWVVLAEQVPFLVDQPIPEGEETLYTEFQATDHTASLYEHCLRAINHSLNLGSHGLPKMGTGDWNDAMDSVGDEGRGESVWLGWFLYDVLVRFGDLARNQGDTVTEKRLQAEAGRLRECLETCAWDGAWYKRAFDDEGRALGSSENMECRIDALSQAWAGISGAANPERARQALTSVTELLFNENDGTMALLTPPFEGKEFAPGYIADYLPGVRENGGQYSHAVAWVVKALAKEGMHQEAWRVLGCLNPIAHTENDKMVRKYKAEPYVIPADIYTVHPHNGRGGWTWYTGSAAWTYKVVLEDLLGFKKRGDRLTFEPHLPHGCSGVEITYRYTADTVYRIVIYNSGQGRVVKALYLDGKQVDAIQLMDDGSEHKVKVMTEP